MISYKMLTIRAMAKKSSKQSVTLERLDKSIEDLARITKTGFNEVRREMAEMKDEMAEMRGEIIELKAETAMTKNEVGVMKREITEVKEDITEIKEELRYTNSRLMIIEYDINELKNKFVNREEFENALNRLELVEKKLGIRSPK